MTPLEYLLQQKLPVPAAKIAKACDMLLSDVYGHLVADEARGLVRVVQSMHNGPRLWIAESSDLRPWDR